VSPVAGSSPAPRILVVRFSAIGDLILTTPLLRALRARHPQAQITAVTRSALAPLLSGSPRLNEVIGWDPATPFADLVADLKSRTFTHRLDLHGSLRSARLRWALGGRWGRYSKRRLARGVLIRTKRNIYRDRRPVAERYFDAARGLDVSPDGGPAELFLHREAMTAADAFLAEHELGHDRTLLAVAPGATHATKRWPERHWLALMGRLTARSDVVIVGSAEDAPLANRLAEAGGLRAASAAGRFDLQGTAALIKRSRALAAGDTGLMHMATALGIPVVALFGPTVEAFGFFPYHARATVLERLDLDCRPCSAMGGARCPLGHHRCLEEILPDVVEGALRRLPA
jgi:lipopolysaccharide heptosyltransferase II